MKCHVVKDLLPNYVDDLLSSQTRQDVEAHLQQCADCQRLYEQLQTPLATPRAFADQPAERRQLDFLKKLRRTTLRNILGALTIVVLALGLLTYLFAVGSPVHSANLTVTPEIDGENWTIDLTLSGYRELLVRTKPIYGDKNEQGHRSVIGMIVEPYQLLPSPLMDGDSKAFTYGTTLSSFEYHPDYHIILRLDDKDIVYRAGQLEGVEQ